MVNGSDSLWYTANNKNHGGGGGSKSDDGGITDECGDSADDAQHKSNNVDHNNITKNSLGTTKHVSEILLSSLRCLERTQQDENENLQNEIKFTSS